MIIYVLDTNLRKVGALDEYASIIWTNRYYSAGDFELYISVTDRNLDILREGYYLVRDELETNAMIIERIQIQTDVENGNYMTVTGRCLKSLLYRRIIWNQTSLVGSLETCIARLLDENAIAPTDSSRRIPSLVNRNTLQTGVAISTQFTGDNLGETLDALCESYSLGWDIELIDGRFCFKLYKGTDRSYAQSANPYVIFSNQYENLLTTTYLLDMTEYRNVAKVAGEGEGSARRTVTVGQASGLNRYEEYVDARDISSNNGETDATTYNAQLIARGEDRLSELIYTENFEGEVEANYTYKLNKDYYLGDIVEVVNEYGIAASTRILEIIESEDSTGKYIIPTFSNYIFKEG